MSELRSKVGWHFFVFAFLGRVPLAMNVIGVLTLVTYARGSITDGGIASAVLGLSSGLAGPILGAAADRWGQRRVLTVVAGVNSAALIGLIVVSYSHSGLWILLGACVVAGVSSPQVSPLARVRWMALLGQSGPGQRPEDRSRLAAAMSYEGMVDEVSFVGGPILVGVLATMVAPSAPLAVSAAVTLVSVLAFAWHPTAVGLNQGPKLALRPSLPGRRVAPTSPSLLLAIAGMVFLGGFFGASLVSLTEFLGERGVSEQTGLIYSFMGISSAASAFLMSRLPRRFSLQARWVASSVVIFVAAFSMPAIDSTWVMCVILLVAGVAVGSLLVTLNTIGATAADPRRFALTMVLLTSGITVGQAAGSAATGVIAENAGYPAAAIVTVLFGIAGVLTATATFVRRPRYV